MNELDPNLNSSGSYSPGDSFHLKRHPTHVRQSRVADTSTVQSHEDYGRALSDSLPCCRRRGGVLQQLLPHKLKPQNLDYIDTLAGQTLTSKPVRASMTSEKTSQERVEGRQLRSTLCASDAPPHGLDQRRPVNGE